MLFTYHYPHANDGDARYGWDWSSSRTTLNGSYTYPMVFRNTVPDCSTLTIALEVEDTGSGTVLGRQWRFYYYSSGSGWKSINFTLPESGSTVFRYSGDPIRFSKLTFVPATTPSSSRTWSIYCRIEDMVISEEIPLRSLKEDRYPCGIFVNRYGISKTLNTLYASVDGKLLSVAAAYIHINDALQKLPNALSDEMHDETETIRLYSFVPETGGAYRVRLKQTSGDHWLYLYDQNENLLKDSFTNSAISLEGKKPYYILACSDVLESKGILQVYKEV